MENLKTYKGLLNTTLKGIRIASGKDVEEESAMFIMLGILRSITSNKIANEFISYCLEEYKVDLIIPIKFI